MTAGMLIVGAGECGARAALALRERGYDGPVTLIGDEPHLPYERPPLSKDAMVSEAEPTPKLVGDREHFASRRIDCVTGASAVAIDRVARRVTLADGRTLPYDKLLLATGAMPRRLPLPGADSSRCAYLRTHDDALRIRGALKAGSHVAILGGGFIGLEIAASARKRGASVTVIEALPRILTRGVPEAIAQMIDARHRREGVTLACGKAVLALRETASGIEIALADGSTVAADLLIIGIGAVPVIEAGARGGADGRERDRGRRATAHLRSRTSTRPAIAARSPWRSMAGAACGSNAGATRRIRAGSPRATCWAPEKARRRCHGSGPTSTISLYRSPVFLTKARRRCGVIFPRMPSSCSTSPAMDAWWRRAGSRAATRWRRTSAWPRC